MHNYRIEPKHKSKRAIALSLTKRREGVTSLEAWQEAKITRLSGDIFVLKKRGHQFRCEMEGTGRSRYKRYFWIDPSPNSQQK